MTYLFENLNIETQVNEIIDKTVSYKRFINGFLNSYNIQLETDEIPTTINKFIEKKISEMEFPFITNNDYTYWTEGSLCWDDWYSWYASRDEIYNNSYGVISMEASNYQFNYMITKKDLFEKKIKEINNFLINLRNKLKENGIYTKIVYTNLEYDSSNDTYIFTYDYKSLFRQPYIDIKLVFTKPSSIGGAKPPKSTRSFGMPKPIARFPVDYKPIIDIDIKRLEEPVFVGKSVVEFSFDLFYATQTKTSIDISEVKKNYLHLSIVPTSVNKLNELGLITFSYLRTSDKENEFEINVDKYRQNMFINKKFGKKIFDLCNYLKKIIDVYKKIFITEKSYNTFFIEKIEKLFNKYSTSYYENFINVVEKWFISKFRPAINAFIKEFNNDLRTLLLNVFKEAFDESIDIKLFVAGGDAMRRYDDNISFTKDIDTKFYVRGVINRYIELGLGTHEQIKQILVNFVAEKIVKLRNYLEENIESILYEDCLKELDEKILTYKALSKKYHIELYNPTLKLKNQYFRVREITQNANFPVDLYSIDFRTYFTEFDKDNNFITKRQHMISILDVVFQDNEEDLYKPDYVKDFEEIPVASLEFLLQDFYTTYTTEKRALARISSDKYKKDIVRFNKLLDIFKTGIKEPIYIPDTKINSLIDMYKSLSSNQMKTYILSILLNYKNKKQLSLCDYLIMIRLLKFRINEDLRTLFKDIIFMKKNLLFESLNIIDNSYLEYQISNVVINSKSVNYLELFKHLIYLKDGIPKHAIPFFNNLIIKEWNKITSSIKSKRQKTSPKSKPKRKSLPSPSISSSPSIPKTPSYSPPPLPSGTPPIFTRLSPPITSSYSPSPLPKPKIQTRSGRNVKQPVRLNISRI